jgi:hypothetical protein
MFNLRGHIASKPIADAPFIRHLRTADVFNEITETRKAERAAMAELEIAMAKHVEAATAYEAARAKAELMQSMEDL